MLDQMWCVKETEASRTTARFWGDDVLKEFDYGEEVRDGSITRQALKIKSNCLKMFVFLITQKKESMSSMHSSSIQIKEKNVSRNPQILWVPSPLLPPEVTMLLSLTVYILLVFKLYIHGVIQYILFYTWISPLNVLFMGFIYVAAHCSLSTHNAVQFSIV